MLATFHIPQINYPGGINNSDDLHLCFEHSLDVDYERLTSLKPAFMQELILSSKGIIANIVPRVESESKGDESDLKIKSDNITLLLFLQTLKAHR